MMGKPFTSQELPLSPAIREGRFSRVDLEFEDMDHSGPTFEVRVFLNNARADEDTPLDDEHGYAGSLYVLGHGQCFGDVGHCEVNAMGTRPFDHRQPHPLVPYKGVLIATDAIRRLAPRNSSIIVTVVPVIMSADEEADIENALKFSKISLVSYQ